MAAYILSEDEIKTVLRELKRWSPDALYPFVFPAVHTGARLMELMTLEWKQVDFPNGLVHINTGKTGKVRAVRMSEDLRVLLGTMGRSSGCRRVFTRW